MTREEHKENLLAIMDSMPDDACGDWRDSLAYAIKALEQEPRFILHADGKIEQIREAVADWKPQLVAGPKIGHWMSVKGYEGILWECSECHDKWHHTTIKWNYCPTCGRRNGKGNKE